MGRLENLNIEDIKKIIPHRYPFLLVDRIEEVELGKRAVGYKCVTANEEFFQGHFPNYPVMPGVLMVEAMAQVGAVALLAMEENKGRLAFFAGIEKVRFKKQVIPGDLLKIEVEILSLRGPLGKGKGTITVDGKVAVTGELLFALGEGIKS
ncbi:3-hydroxyacyl-ACP dehydratase FabZ [Anaerobranca gottschalkii]|uniref:3-hydroxyacyl-[acyl-carrier-protein] dehydratase FabZ n=1 Tax=Anaerobranca gottschalkii DSM 13577 TaxID=1120990 RepID=A0A1H9Z1S4_9FIRM|nr:3-hydroxyacyl-ACP dehydratase FabZ [Anaerobranca gottschalkii]SES75448.1 3-hydroxyacyl-[acyl-carrier-protein] dehydratase [Anaerobranca gottschalkii DSM 13577]